jgi:eukaryotic-like serine/threonine-protein kinase
VLVCFLLISLQVMLNPSPASLLAKDHSKLGSTTRVCAKGAKRSWTSLRSVLVEGAAESREVAQAHRRIGTWIGQKWQISELLGLGGMGAVYAAVHRNGKSVAIKVMHPELVHSDETCERFLAEGVAANRVAHPGTASVMDDGITEDGSPFLVMDLLKGSTLDQVVEESGVVPLIQLLHWMEQLLDVLATAHDRGIVHRDVKPKNLLVNEGGQVYLLDFGIALVPGAPETQPAHERCRLGTPDYMPPEQRLGLWTDVDGRTDLWAVGATMFWALSGHLVRDPHGAEGGPIGGTEPTRSLATVAPDLDEELIALVDRALRSDKEARWASARNMRVAVREVMSRLSEQPVPSSRPPRGVDSPWVFPTHGFAAPDPNSSLLGPPKHSNPPLLPLALPVGPPATWIRRRSPSLARRSLLSRGPQSPKPPGVV